MRLTLRTLLAWLDDTLSPGEVREIGKQVAESPFAKDLVEKIHKVTRQRRLTVPPSSGPDAVDANLVASYLDNELAPDPVNELEKRCLTSDVALAEVASVHQILSLIGQKAKVPAEARKRMYKLVKGRESGKSAVPRPSRSAESRRVTEPIAPWVTPVAPPRPWYEQFLPVGVVVAMVVVLGWTAAKSLSTEPGPDLIADAFPENRAAAAPAEKSDEAAKAPEPAAAAAKNDPETEEGKALGEIAAMAPADVAKPEEKAKAADVPKGEIPAGSVALAPKTTGVLLRYSPEKRDWDRLTDETPLREQDRLLSLAPFRSTIEFGSAKVDLVGETEVWVAAHNSSEAAKLTVGQGRVALHGTTPPLPFVIQFGGKSVQVTPPAGGVVGVERLNRRGQGEASAKAPILRFTATEGPVELAEGEKKETIKGAGSVTYGTAESFIDPSNKPAPPWVTEAKPTEFDRVLGDDFVKFFRPNRPVVTCLVEASEDEQANISRYAVSGLRAVGDISYVVPLLNKKSEPNSATQRRAAIQVLRAYLSEGPEAAKNLREQLLKDLGTDMGPKVEKLLVGYTPKEAKDEATFMKLVGHLATTEDDEVGLRELALDNLQELTGRDDLDYDPEKPEGKGLKAWKDLLRTHELKTAGAKE